ncbi:MAG: arsenosugar biosynthesis radical SAM (seleno)protein ArsS, partial [Candidatus Binataceae bacterium]
ISRYRAPVAMIQSPTMGDSLQRVSSHDFDAMLAQSGIAPLRRSTVRTLQVNVGKVCNQACHHCHVDAGPSRTERMERSTAERVIEVLERSTAVATLDITGGAPELNENFAMLVEQARALSREVIVRCNLTVIFVEGMSWLVEFYRRSNVHLICSLPCYTAENVQKQRGRGVFEQSIEALRRLNSAGFGRGTHRLDLVHNPIGASLPPAQAQLEARYRDELGRDHSVWFDRLLTLANMPIARFAHQLERSGCFNEYMGLLVNHFNPATVDALMCRSLVSVGYEGTLYDCDFNQMLGIELRAAGSDRRVTIWDVEDLDALTGARIATGAHCFGCTAGAGSSCAGALAD